jgi:hypothetical protein
MMMMMMMMMVVNHSLFEDACSCTYVLYSGKWDDDHGNESERVEGSGRGQF